MAEVIGKHPADRELKATLFVSQPTRLFSFRPFHPLLLVKLFGGEYEE